MLTDIGRGAPAILIDLCVGVAGFALSLVWGKLSGRALDRGTVLVLAGLWMALTLIGVILAFVM